MDDADRKQVYHALLRGIANDAQDALCAQGKHGAAWGQWTRYAVKPDDVPEPPLALGEPIPDRQYRVAARRTCLNCGAEEFTDNA